MFNWQIFKNRCLYIKVKRFRVVLFNYDRLRMYQYKIIAYLLISFKRPAWALLVELVHEYSFIHFS